MFTSGRSSCLKFIMQWLGAHYLKAKNLVPANKFKFNYQILLPPETDSDNNEPSPCTELCSM